MGFAATQGPYAGEHYHTSVSQGRRFLWYSGRTPVVGSSQIIGSKGCAHGALGRGVEGRSITWLAVVPAGALPHLKAMLEPSSSPVIVLWASRLLKALAQVSRSPTETAVYVGVGGGCRGEATWLAQRYERLGAGESGSG